MDGASEPFRGLLRMQSRRGLVPATATLEDGCFASMLQRLRSCLPSLIHLMKGTILATHLVQLFLLRHLLFPVLFRLVRLFPFESIMQLKPLNNYDPLTTLAERCFVAILKPMQRLRREKSGWNPTPAAATSCSHGAPEQGLGIQSRRHGCRSD